MAEKPFSGSEDKHIIVLCELEKLQNQNLQDLNPKMHDRVTDNWGYHPCRQIRKLNGTHSAQFLGVQLFFKIFGWWVNGDNRQQLF